MVVINGKVSGNVHRTTSDLNGHAVNGKGNVHAKATSLNERYQVLSEALKVARRELDHVSNLVAEQADDAASSAASSAVEKTTSKAAIDQLSWKGRSSLPEKQFNSRQSVLTDMFDIPHLRTVYNMAIVVVIMLFVNDFVIEYVVKGEYPIFFKTVATISFGFTGLHRALGIWLVMFLATTCVYAAFTWWAETRSRLVFSTRLAYDYFCIAAMFTYMGVFTYLPVWRMRVYGLGIASVAAVLLEQVRLLMKTYAFVRTNVPRALEATKDPLASHAEDEDEDDDNSKLRRKAYPGFSNYLYFLFAPTLVYRDEYPRSKKIRWGFVATCFLEVAFAIFLGIYMLERFMLPQTRVYGNELPAGLATYASIVASNILPFFLMMFTGHYLLLHAWQNAFAEMLRFGDRMFYLDWWNQRDYSAWFRTWNIVVQDWLYMYLYRDVAKMTGSKNMARMSVFIVSAAVHEYILAIAFQYCMPLQMFMFGVIGAAMIMFNLRSNSALGNIYLIFSVMLGNTMMAAWYSVEYYARLNCPQVLDDKLDYFVPRSWNCTSLTA